MVRERCVQNRGKWHKWWAWHPIKLRDEYKGDRICWKWVWLEEVWRKCYYGCGGSSWDYSLEEPK